jgi:hypothetical protein
VRPARGGMTHPHRGTSGRSVGAKQMVGFTRSGTADHIVFGAADYRL